MKSDKDRSDASTDPLDVPNLVNLVKRIEAQDNYSIGVILEYTRKVCAKKEPVNPSSDVTVLAYQSLYCVLKTVAESKRIL